MSIASSLPVHNTSEFQRFALGVAALALLMNALARGMIDAFAVFVLPLSTSFGWTRADISLGYAIYMLSYGLVSPFVGMIFDRLGLRVTWLIGAVTLGLGFGLASQMDSLWQFYVLVGLSSGVGMACLGMVTASALVARWFKRELSTVMSVVYAGMGVGMLAIVPALQWVVGHSGWRTGYLSLAVLMWVFVPLFAWILPMRRMSAGADFIQQLRNTPSSGPQATEWSVGNVWRHSAFWGLFGVFFFTTACVYAVVPQCVAYLVEHGIAPLTAATAYGLTGTLSVIGMLGMGWLARRIGERRAAAVSYASTILGIASLMVVAVQPHLIWVYGFVLFFGSNQGARGPMVATVAARLFSGRGFSGIYGAMTTGLGVGGAMGSYASGWLHDLTGSYYASFGMAIGLAMCGLLPFMFVRALRGATEIPQR
jgi:MFS family permease